MCFQLLVMHSAGLHQYKSNVVVNMKLQPSILMPALATRKQILQVGQTHMHMHSRYYTATAILQVKPG